MKVWRLSVRRRDEHLKSLQSDLDEMLNQQPHGIHVVDAETYMLRYTNRHLQNLRPEAQVGNLCYRALYGLEKPCEVCPITTDDGQCILRNKLENRDVNATASRIHWDGKPAWFVSCTGVTEEDPTDPA